MPQVQEAFGPGLEGEVDDLLLIEVVDDLLEHHAGELLLVLVGAFVPEAGHHVEDFHAHAQLDGGFLDVGGPRLPMRDLAFERGLALHVFLSGYVAVLEEIPSRFDLTPELSDGRLLLALDVILDRAGAALFSLNCHLDHQGQPVFFDAQHADQLLEVVLDDLLEHGTSLTAALDTFRMPVAQLAMLIDPTQP